MSDDSPSTGAAWLPEGRLVDGLGALRVEIDAGVPGEPIKGHVDASSGGRTEFSGWIELVAAIEAARVTAATRPENEIGTRPTSARRAG